MQKPRKIKKAAVLSAEGTALYHPTRAGAESRNLEEYLVLVPRGGRRAREIKKKASTVSPRSAEHCIPPLSAPRQRAEGPEIWKNKKDGPGPPKPGNLEEYLVLVPRDGPRAREIWKK